MENTCTCGDTRVRFYPDENQYEPNCWECYYMHPNKAVLVVEEHMVEEHTIYCCIEEYELPF